MIHRKSSNTVNTVTRFTRLISCSEIRSFLVKGHVRVIPNSFSTVAKASDKINNLAQPNVYLFSILSQNL